MTKSRHKYPIDLSIILAFHNEGHIAHKTLLNVFDLVKPLDKQGITYEILLHADNPDPATRELLEGYATDPRCRIFNNTFGNPSDSRNFCIKEAKGQYLAILDGDDLLSKNWLIDGYRLMEDSSTPIILHAEADITFGIDEGEPRIWIMTDARTLDEDAAMLFTRNRWGASLIVPKDVALAHPYKSSRHGLGYEDWVFNMDTRQSGVLHKIIPKSVRFYRMRSDSTYSAHGADNAVTPYSEMFSTENVKKLAQRFEKGDFLIKSPNTNRERLARVSRSAMRTSHKFVTAIPRVGGLAQRGFNYRDRLRGRKVFSRLPQYIQDAWIEANQLDGEVWPDPLKLSKLWRYESDYNDLTALYCRLASKISKDPDYLFLPPQLSVGGTEKVLVNYLNAFAELHPDWHIVVLAALPAKHPYKIPNNVDFVDFQGLMHGRSWFEVDFILSRFIVQTKVKRLHIIHNELAYLWAKNHRSLLCHNDYELYISQFMDEYNQDSRLKVGFVDPWIRNVAPAITKIFTDNVPFAQEIIQRTGLPAEKVVAHFQPIVPLSPVRSGDAEQPKSDEQPFRILWASRVSPQKRPDLLKKIAQQIKTDPALRRCTIDVYGRCQPPYTGKYFADLDSIITYKGVYNGIESLDLSQYDAYLYTSQTDGLPNVLLEIASSELPIVASNVGGVSDIVNSETGYPIAMDDVSGYVGALRDILQHPADAHKKAAKAREIVTTRHSWTHFLDQVKADIK